MHTPWLFSGGIDIKAGQWVTLEGAETIDPTTNYFYSHTYIFNFGIPFDGNRHHDDLACRSAARYLCRHRHRREHDLRRPQQCPSVVRRRHSASICSAAISRFSPPPISGRTLPIPTGPTTLLDTIAACHCNPGDTLRFLNDITATWKINDSWTLITDANYIHDDGTYAIASGFGTFHPDGYGIAQYAIYTVNDWLKAVGRAEVWRDNDNFFVAAFPGNIDFVNAEHGFLNTSIAGGPLGGGTTYFEITGGLNIAPTIPKDTPLLQSITFRPEVRYDTSLNGTTPFDGVNVPGGRGTPGFGVGAKGEQFTFGGDIIAKF